MTVSSCSTSPSVELIAPPKINVEVLKPVPPSDVMKGCDDLLLYDSTDEREVLTVTIKNHNIYFICASKLRSAIIFINNS